MKISNYCDINLPFLQRGPVHPRAHVHLPGDVHLPPFAQGGWHGSKEGVYIRNFTKSWIYTHEKLIQLQNTTTT